MNEEVQPTSPTSNTHTHTHTQSHLSFHLPSWQDASRRLLLHAGTLILHFSAARTMKKEMPILYKLPSLWYSVISRVEWTREND
jgi:hypothetical protein